MESLSIFIYIFLGLTYFTVLMIAIKLRTIHNDIGVLFENQDLLLREIRKKK